MSDVQRRARGGGAMLLAVVLGLAGMVGPAVALEPGQREPKRLYAIGDSISRAFDADLPGDNLHLSWVSGSRGLLERLLRLPNVQSHHQRINANFGASGRRNVIAARNGARISDLRDQAAGVRGRDVTYATVMLGGNDVCRDSIADLPTDAEFAIDAALGLVDLFRELPRGATVQVVGIPDIRRLYEVGRDKTALRVVDCELLWSLSALGFPCGSMLSPSNTEADRDFVAARNEQYNLILLYLTALAQAKFTDLHISFTNAVFDAPFTEEHLSNLDCYHPSWEGQQLISERLWNAGPFAASTALE